MTINLCYFAGIGLAAVGLWWIWPPLALIELGLAVVWFALLWARGERDVEKRPR